MNPMKAPFTTALTLATLLFASAPSHAQTAVTPAPAVAEVALPQSDAEVRKIDTRAGKITLKHGDIPNLDMPPMTMVFQVREGVLPAEIKVGDKVRFRADKVNGAYTVTDIVLAP
jgi:Cu/Ag efflux protein CusF